LDAGVASGREFEFEVVAQAAGLSENAALDAVDELLSIGVIRPLDGSWFAFDHTLTMEVAYREVGELRHRLMHRRVAEAVQTVHRENLDEFSGQLAFHFGEGNEPQRAAPYAFRAGQNAARLAAWKEAIAFYEQALHGSGDPKPEQVLKAMGEAHMYAGQFAQASETFREIIRQAQVSGKTDFSEIKLLLGRSLLPQARFAEIITLAQQVCSQGKEEYTRQAELLLGTALSIEGADLEAARHRLTRAAELAQGSSAEDARILGEIQFELGSVTAQQGDLPAAVAYYRQALESDERAGGYVGLEQSVLAYNNLAYHLHLLGDPSALAYAETGLKLARERGLLGMETWLLSTLGEIALGRQDLEAAEKYFSEGLQKAESFNMPERIAGLTANLGLVAIQRNQNSVAIHRLSTALGLADALGTRHLAAQIRLWLAPLLPPHEAQARLNEARLIVESSGRKRLLAELNELEEKVRQQAGWES
jgi:tetratricopeptide (TPR) repeat protein